MKRFSCVSALLVGLSLTVASTALAAPPAPPAKAKKGVVKPKTEKKAKQAPEEETKATPETAPADSVVQATDPPPADGAGGTPTTPAPATEPAPATDPNATPATTEPQPAVSVGTAPATTSDSPSTAPPAPTAPPKPRPFAGSNIFAFTSMSTATVFKQQQNDYNPSVDSSIWLAPRYAINKDFQLRALSVFSYEYTNSDDTVTKNEPRFSDTTVSLFYRSIPEIATIKPMIAINTGLPTSPESRARTMIVSPGATLQLSKMFEKFLGGELMLLSSLMYSHPLYSNTTGGVRGEFPYSRQCAGGTGCANELNGVFNPSDVFMYSFMFAPSWGKWSPALFYRGRSVWTYTGSQDITANDVQPGLGNQPIGSNQSGGPTAVRQTSYFSAWVDYNVNAWMTAEVGYWLDRASVLNAGSRYANPFFDRYADMRVYIGASFQVDNILKALEGGGGEAGIVRAKNTKQPMWNF